MNITSETSGHLKHPVKGINCAAIIIFGYAICAAGCDCKLAVQNNVHLADCGDSGHGNHYLRLCPIPVLTGGVEPRCIN